MLVKAPLRFVIDTNVFISALLNRDGPPALVTRQVTERGQAVFSKRTFAELRDRLWKPKFDRYITIEQRNRFIGDLEATVFWIDIPPTLAANRYSRDASDDMFIHAAFAANAICLVTGDSDLLCLHPIETLPILSPRAALDFLKKCS